MNKGFTLIETLIYVAIIGMVITSFVLFSLSISDPTEKTYGTEEVNSNLRIVETIISRQIRNSKSVNVDSSIFDSNEGFLSLEYENVSQNPTLIGLSQEGKIELKVGSNASTTITSEGIDVSILNFSNTSSNRGPENILYTIEASYSASSTPAFSSSNSITTSVSLRK